MAIVGKYEFKLKEKRYKDKNDQYYLVFGEPKIKLPSSEEWVDGVYYGKLEREEGAITFLQGYYVMTKEEFLKEFTESPNVINILY